MILGKVGQVSRLGFGCGTLSGVYNQSRVGLSHEAGCEIIRGAFNKGVTFFDTADIYGNNRDNEIMVGKALKTLPREKVQLATKFGVVIAEDGPVGAKGTPEYVRECCEASLKSLNVDYIDLYYQRRVGLDVPIEGTMGELKKPVEEGKIRYIGLSEANVDTVKRAHAIHPISTLQMEYSLWTRDIEKDIIPLCRELVIGVVAYSPIGLGFFGGKAVDENFPAESLVAYGYKLFQQFGWFLCMSLVKNKVLYSRLANLATKHRCTPPQLGSSMTSPPSRKWRCPDPWYVLDFSSSWKNGSNICFVLGCVATTKVKNLENNIGAVIVKFAKEDLKEISDAIPTTDVCGHRNFSSPLLKYNYDVAITPPKNHLTGL